MTKIRMAALCVLLVALSLALAMPASARTHRRSRRAAKARPAGNLRVYVLAAGPGDPLPGYYTVRVVDSFGGKWESRPDADGLAEFAGVPPGRAVLTSWSAPSDSTTSPCDTVWIVKGKVAVDTLRVRNGRHAH